MTPTKYELKVLNAEYGVGFKEQEDSKWWAFLAIVLTILVPIIMVFSLAGALYFWSLILAPYIANPSTMAIEPFEWKEPMWYDSQAVKFNKKLLGL